ncbi:ras guanine nucleotide exchange factor domain-containing protein [Chiua virens]|nr:ras guanine nucleotide exchange factor domain-containing protein [Chiua virens]
MAAPSIDTRHTTPVRNSIRGLPAIPTATKRTHQSDLSRDFWIPQVTETGQIYYANTLTGKLSRDLPRDPEDDGVDDDLVSLGFRSSTSRSGDNDLLDCFIPETGPTEFGRDLADGTQTELSHVLRLNDALSLPSSPAGFQVSDIPQTHPAKPLPSPLDTGMAAARPRAHTDLASSTRNSHRVPGFLFDTLASQLRQRSFSASDPSRLSFHHKRSISSEGRPSISNSSAHHTPASRLKEFFQLPDVPDIQEPQPPESSRRSTTSIEQTLAPPTPDVVSHLLQRARQCIHSVILHLKQFGIPQLAEDEEIVDNLMCAAITAIRDLLYVSGPSFRHLGGKHKPDTDTSNAVPDSPDSCTTSCRCHALQICFWIAGDDVSQLNSDAEELERSVVEFVSIAQGVRSQGDHGPKRLHGYMTAPHADPVLAGAGTAGTWKGFGWVDIEDHEEAPRQTLSAATFDEFVIHVSRVQERLSTLMEFVRATRPAEVVTTSAQELFRELSSLVLFLGDIHIARHVDIETVDQTELEDGAQYMRVVEKARVLVRSFEATIQAIYDDGAALLVATQRIRRVEPCESWIGRDTTYDALEALTSSLDFNLNITRQNLEGLVRVGTEQTVILERCHQSPLEWRMSQRSLVAAIMANQALETVYDDYSASDVTADESDKTSKAEEAVDEPPSPSSESAVPTPVSAGGTSHSIPSDGLGTLTPSQEYDRLKTMRTLQRPDKIKAFFGDDAPSHYLISMGASAKPWYLRPHYNPEEVLIDPDGTVRGGTVPALVERLTAHEYADSNYTRAFLMTFKSFMTLDELFNLLVDRFWIQPPPNLNSKELEEWRYNKQNIIRIRVINTMKLIAQGEELVDKEDMRILDRMAQFASRDDVFKVAGVRPLLAAIKRAAGNVRKVTLQSSVPPPAPIVPKRIELLDIDPLELARQLTITESQLYLKIRPSECFQRSKQSRTEYHDGVANFIRRSNRIANWVTYSILCKDDPRRRAAVIKQFILVADRCRVIQNFSTMVAIVTGLNSSPIQRLKRSLEQVSSRYMSQLETCEALINSYKHYNSYRSTLAALAPPCVPFIGVFLTTLTHIQDGSKDHLPGNLVNFRKRQKASEVIQDLQRWQAQPHNFHPLPSVLVFIDEALNQFGDHDASEVFWKLSLEREPREKDEEKLAKWLSDSGFF